MYMFDCFLRFEVDKTMFDVLNNHCKITVPDIVPFTLVKSENLPSNHILEPINQLHIPSMPLNFFLLENYVFSHEFINIKCGFYLIDNIFFFLYFS